MIDIKFHPEHGRLCNDVSSAKIVLEFFDHETPVNSIDDSVRAERRPLPRIMLSNLASGLQVSKIERQCLEVTAELPEEIMRKAGLVRNKMIFVYNASRGGMSAESYVVPNTRDSNVVISGALSRVADVEDIISEAAFTITNKIRRPTIFNAKKDV